MEKYLTLSWGDHIVFKDSLQFMSCSLEKLAENLQRSGKGNFKILKSEFSGTDEQFDLLLRKGIYPYDYMDDMQKFGLPHLPTQAEFANRLRDSKCSDSEYQHAQNIWAKFRCSLMKDYHDLYLKTDVLLLADIFESFRQVSIEK